MRKTLFLGAAVAALVTAQPSYAQSLIKDGGFESPKTPSGSFVTYTLGQKIHPWTVVGPSGSNVSLVSTVYTNGGFSFPARAGHASLDLTGGPDTGLPQGVAQTVTTVVGQTYQLTFSVGNVYAPGGQFGTTSTVNVYIDQTLALSATNTKGKGSTKMVWKRFTTTFMAANDQTPP